MYRPNILIVMIILSMHVLPNLHCDEKKTLENLVPLHILFLHLQFRFLIAYLTIYLST